MPTSPSGGPRGRFAAPSGVAGIVVSVVLASVLSTLSAACTTPVAADDTSTAAPVPPAESTSVAPVVDGRAVHYAQVLHSGGFPEVVPAQTLFALADGVCRQTAAGTPDAVILEQLWPVGSYAAGRSEGALTAEGATRLMLDTARSDFC